MTTVSSEHTPALLQPLPSLLPVPWLSQLAGSASRLPSRQQQQRCGRGMEIYFKCDALRCVCSVFGNRRVKLSSSLLSLSCSPSTHLQPLNGNRMWAEAETSPTARCMRRVSNWPAARPCQLKSARKAARTAKR